MLMLYNSDMKKKITYFVMSLSLAFSVGAVPLAAHAESIGRVGASRANAEVATTTADVPTTTATDDSAGRVTRLEAYKKSLKEALTAAAKARIIERCVAAQVIVKTKVANNDVVATARTNAYDEIVKKLQSVVTAGKAKNVDVSELETEITTLEAKIAAFQTANTAFHQALSDLQALGCKTDPTAFKATLETARTDQLAVFTSAKDIRAYLNDTVKATLQALKTKLNS